MKPQISIGLACCVAALSAQAQEFTNAPSPSIQRATPVSSRVLERGQNFSKIESITQKQDASGQTVLKTNRYTHLKMGINRKDPNGNWIESQPVLLNLPEGIVGTGGVYTVTISPNLNTWGAVDLLLPDGQRFQSHAVGLSWYDPDSGRSALLAGVKSCVAEISTNQVIFRDAFDSGVSAAVVYKYEAGQFQQDVVFHSSPPSAPADFGPRTRLEVLTEIIGQPDITKQVRTIYEEKDPGLRAARAEPDLVDETLTIGGTNGMLMVPGRAYPMGDAPQKIVPVLKRLITTSSGRIVLIESMLWETVRADFEKLPKTAAVAPRSRPPSRERELPAPLLARTDIPKDSEVLLAAAPITRGYVIDYQEVNGSAGSYYFNSDETYLISYFYVGFGYFYARTVLKFDYSSQMWIDNMGINSDVTITALDDDSVGETILGSTGTPLVSYYGTPAIGTMSSGANYVSGATFRYQTTAYYSGNGGSLTLSDSSLSDCVFGLEVSGDMDLQNVQFCNVDNPFYAGGSETFSNISECTDTDSDSDGMPWAWELNWFGSTSQTGAGDYDSDGVSNYLEYAMGRNPIVAGSVADNGTVNLSVFTPLK